MAASATTPSSTSIAALIGSIPCWCVDPATATLLLVVAADDAIAAAVPDAVPVPTLKRSVPASSAPSTRVTWYVTVTSPAAVMLTG